MSVDPIDTMLCLSCRRLAKKEKELKRKLRMLMVGCDNVIGWLRLEPERRTQAGADALANDLAKLVRAYAEDDAGDS